MTLEGLTYSQQYWIKRYAKELGMTVEQYMASPHYRPRKTKAQAKAEEFKPADLTKVKRLNQLMVSGDLMKLYKTDTMVDAMFSHEGGIPVGTNVMCTGDPGVGKTTMLMHTLSKLQYVNPEARCLFVSAEMSKLQVFKYTQRFPEFSNLETMFTSDFLGSNFREVLESLLVKGYDYVLMDSIAEVLDSVKEDCGMSQGQAEKWLIDLCVKHNEANNEDQRHTTFLLIQQVTKNGVFVGSNKLKHITDAHMEMKRDSDRDGGGTYIVFSKNRNGAAGVRYNFRLGSNSIKYEAPTYDNTEQREPARTFSIGEEISF
jgi:predicted ATP-dependent serine protease